jgi:UDP-glucose 4-epimerase
MTPGGKRVFVTGGTGFLGSYVLEHLQRLGNREIAVLIRPGSRASLGDDVLDGIRLIEGSLDDLDAMREELASFAPDTVVHCAWDGVGPNERDHPRQLRNIHASIDLLSLAHEVGATHWIGMGSQAEYGPHLAAIRETDPTRPTTLYGACKLSVWHLGRLSAGRRGMRFVWLRIFSTYGPRDHLRWLIPYVIVSLLKGERPVLTEGRQLWDYVHVEDIAAAIVGVVDDVDAEGVYNVGSGRVVTVRRVVERIRDLIDPNLPIGFGELLYRPDQVMHLEADIGRLQRAIGWKPRIDLDEGLAATVEWYRANRSRFDA